MLETESKFQGTVEVNAEDVRDLRVLVLSRNYPNNVMELFGLWVESLVRHSTTFCRSKVVSPVPYCPALKWLPETYRRYRRVYARDLVNGVEVLHPRFFVGPGYSMYRLEWLSYYMGVRKSIAKLRKDFKFNLIHAHCTYPDGVVAARLGQRYRVPVIITEQNPWGPWMNKYSDVLRKAIWAAQRSAYHIAISESVKKTIEEFGGGTDHLVVIPDGVDGASFTLPAETSQRIPNQILFVGAIRRVKGADILLKALRLLAERGRDIRLVLIGEAFYKTYNEEELRLRKMAVELRLEKNVQFAGKQPLPALVRYMQESAALVLPSRAESLGMVLVEALSCGTPVVATRCGGPEDIVNENVGVLVEKEDPDALSRGIEYVLDHNDRYEPKRLHEYASEKFGLPSVGQRVLRLYDEARRRSLMLAR